MPRKRCPNGSRRNKKTGRCRKTEKSKQILEKKEILNVASLPKHSPKQLTQKRKRCPKGTRKNKKTGLCEPTKSKIQKQLSVLQTSPVIDVPPIENIEELGRVVYKLLKRCQPKKQK